jgi:hypothetical protein
MSMPAISVIQPVSQAVERVKQVLFRPFDLARWFVIGFGAWLAGLGQGGGYNFNFNPGRAQQVDLPGTVERARDYVSDNLFWIAPLAAVIVLLVLALWIVLLWLSSRGRFMFLHCVALNRAEVAVPWSRFARAGNSVFWFRLVLGPVYLALALAILIPAAFSAYRMCLGDAWGLVNILTLVAFALVFFAVALVFGIIGMLLSDFVIPLMFLRGGSCLAGWAALRSLLAAHLGSFILYFLFQIVLGLVIAMMVVIAVLITCCLAGCLLIIPYLGTVALLPVLVFRRAYSLCFLAQFGPAFDVFSPAAPPALIPPPPVPTPIPPPANGTAGI